jgi:hypothetical protein
LCLNRFIKRLDDVNWRRAEHEHMIPVKIFRLKLGVKVIGHVAKEPASERKKG